MPDDQLSKHRSCRRRQNGVTTALMGGIREPQTGLQPPVISSARTYSHSHVGVCSPHDFKIEDWLRSIPYFQTKPPFIQAFYNLTDM